MKQQQNPDRAPPDGSEHGGGDLGRRIAEQRDHARLPRQEAAERAGMSTGYLEYLETSPRPNPSQGDLIRLAAALGTTPAILGGAGINLPPGQRRAAQHAVLETLSVAECREHLAAGGVGRFLFVADRGPVAIPVNYRMLGDDIVFRAGSATSVPGGSGQSRVSFDVDHLDDVLAEGWSVLVSGEAAIVTAPAELRLAEALRITPWAGGDRDTFIKIVAREVTGRRIRANA